MTTGSFPHDRAPDDGRPRHAAQSTARSPFKIGNWRVRSRLIALILIPTVVAVFLGGVSVTNAIKTGVEYQRLTEIAELVERISRLTHELERERDLTTLALAEAGTANRPTRVEGLHATVDRLSGEVRGRLDKIDQNHGTRERAKADRVGRWLDGLPGMRELAATQVPPRAAFDMYTRMIEDMSGLHDELGRDGDDAALFSDALALNALTQLKEAIARQRGILSVALAEKNLGYDDIADFLGAWSQQETELARFRSEAEPADLRFFDATVNGPQVNQTDAIRALVLNRVRAGTPVRDIDPRRTDDVKVWFDVSTATLDRVRAVEERLTTSVVAAVRDLQSGETRGALVIGGLTVALLLLVLAITVGVARSLVRPLRRLRTEALEVAGNRLPDTVRAIRDSGDAGTDPRIEPIGLDSGDEIGEVARAFDEVHREAVRLAADEARVRRNVNTMFVNLSRRSQTLVERQLALIDGLERGEEDEDRLEDLFRLDHLATRMRRNSENLLVLAGQETARRWSKPVQLVDVVRAALAEVEGYERVELEIALGTSVAGQAVNDTVHLVAELVENALSFSSGETHVTVSSRVTDAGEAMVVVDDAGIGMTEDELAQANWRLAHPPTVDVSVSRRMGLFVVGRLAARHGIGVHLRPRPQGGLTALVRLPHAIVSPDGLGVRPVVPADRGLPHPAPERPAVAADPVTPVREAATPPHPGFAELGPPLERSGNVADIVLPTGRPPAWSSEEYLPIFAAVESDWFRSGGAGGAGRRPGAEPAAAENAPPAWRASRSDSGWSAAEAVQEPASGGVTSAGLPKRVPKANLVPGSADQGEAAPAPPVLSADRVRNRLSSFQQGLRQGRAESRALKEDS
ncbi:sensor histidine kinase [Rhizohabitans arisaemae]|uniref:sensor histidine kinase n=1 Tax=Rhizohabitans arisaemae TaxID=2720610 RepID=UPI0024B1D30E|nr:nitrate- and nitrite sensing domain-containing protein [Rhizohabitans arisaemae]